MKRFVSSLLWATVFTPLACNIYTEALLDGEANLDAGADAEGGAINPEDCAAGACWWSTKTAEGCDNHVAPTPEDRPATNPGLDVGVIYFAIDKIWLGESAPVPHPSGVEPWQYFGLNLDQTCTNSAGCASAPKNQISCRAGIGVPADGLGCRDNMFARLQPIAAAQPTLGPPFGISENSFNCELHRGSFSVLIKVTGYNGLADDDQVRLDFYMSPGLEEERNNIECPNSGWDQHAPWLANKRWLVDEAMLAEPQTGAELPASKLNSTTAFVRGGYLVGALPDGATVRFIGDNAAAAGFSMDFHKGIFVARPVLQSDGLWRAEDGLMAGRVKQQEILRSFSEIGFCVDAPLPESGATVSQADVSLLTDYLSVNMDVTASGVVDSSVDCDAMSVGIAFTARQASPGRAVAVSKLEECPNGGTPGVIR